MLQVRFNALPIFFYADDVFLFYMDSLANVKKIIHIFKEYGKLSSQFVNWSKSKIIFGKFVTPSPY